jgi:hypothetical protein
LSGSFHSHLNCSLGQLRADSLVAPQLRVYRHVVTTLPSCRLNNLANPFLFRDTILKLLAAKTLPCKTLMALATL